MMENTNRFTIPAGETPEKKNETNDQAAPWESVFFGNAGENLKKYATNMRAPHPLETLCENFHRLHRLFVLLKSPWLAGNTKIQKACAWYLAQARPAPEEARILTESLNGFTLAAHYFAEWNGLINRMEKFFHTEEKELKEWLEYKKKTEGLPAESSGHVSPEGIAYSRRPGGREMYGIVYRQLEELHRTMGRFIGKEASREMADYPQEEAPDITLVALYRKLGHYLHTHPRDEEPSGC